MGEIDQWILFLLWGFRQPRCAGRRRRRRVSDREPMVEGGDGRLRAGEVGVVGEVH